MDLLESVLHQVVIFAGEFSPKLVIILFLVLAIGEFGIFSIPYLLETVWLLSGYNFSVGIITFPQLALLWLSALTGRLTGTLTLYFLSRLGALPLKRLYRKYSPSDSSKLADNSFPPFKFLRKLNLLSPFSVALGRLFWLRVPLTLTLAVMNRLKVLTLGVLVSSVILDGIYIVAGQVVGAHVVIRPAQMLLYSLICISTLYIAGIILKRLFTRRTKNTASTNGK
ncbi:MAG: hypothetical protein PHR56_09430 [Dehalococcoidales bacterium]|nr:hypothetical protein [Dehalococcoidales bacterium]